MGQLVRGQYKQLLRLELKVLKKILYLEAGAWRHIHVAYVKPT